MADERVIDGDAFGLLAEGRNLNILRPEEDVDEPEAPPDQARIAEQVAHLLRMRIGGDVEILGTPRQHQIAHTAPNKIGELTGLDQAIEHLEHVGIDIATRDGMLGAFEYMRFQSPIAARGFDCRARLSEISTPMPAIHDGRKRACIANRKDCGYVTFRWQSARITTSSETS